MSEYIEMKGYLIRHGKDGSPGGFILPSKKKEFYKKSKGSQSENTNSTDKKDLIEKIRTLSRKKTEGQTPTQMKDFMRSTFQIENFNELNAKTESYLRRKIEQLEIV